MMTRRLTLGRRLGLAGLGAALLAANVTLLASGAFVAPAGATAPSCTAANTFVWAADAGSGTAGTTYYVIEISNVGSTTCTLSGFSRVWAVNAAGARVGLPSTNETSSTAVPRVTLAPKGTAHEILGVVDPGALCGGKSVNGTGLRVVPPGQTLPASPGERDWLETFPLSVCASVSSLRVEPVRAGTGIPLYTSS